MGGGNEFDGVLTGSHLAFRSSLISCGPEPEDGEEYRESDGFTVVKLDSYVTEDRFGLLVVNRDGSVETLPNSAGAELELIKKRCEIGGMVKWGEDIIYSYELQPVVKNNYHVKLAAGHVPLFSSQLTLGAAWALSESAEGLDGFGFQLNNEGVIYNMRGVYDDLVFDRTRDLTFAGADEMLFDIGMGSLVMLGTYALAGPYGLLIGGILFLVYLVVDKFLGYRENLIERDGFFRHTEDLLSRDLRLDANRTFVLEMPEHIERSAEWNSRLIIDGAEVLIMCRIAGAVRYEFGSAGTGVGSDFVGGGIRAPIIEPGTGRFIWRPVQGGLEMVKGGKAPEAAVPETPSPRVAVAKVSEPVKPSMSSAPSTAADEAYYGGAAAPRFDYSVSTSAPELFVIEGGGGSVGNPFVISFLLTPEVADEMSFYGSQRFADGLGNNLRVEILPPDAARIVNDQEKVEQTSQFWVKYVSEIYFGDPLSKPEPLNEEEIWRIAEQLAKIYNTPHLIGVYMSWLVHYLQLSGYTINFTQSGTSNEGVTVASAAAAKTGSGSSAGGSRKRDELSEVISWPRDAEQVLMSSRDEIAALHEKGASLEEIKEAARKWMDKANELHRSHLELADQCSEDIRPFVMLVISSVSQFSAVVHAFLGDIIEANSIEEIDFDVQLFKTDVAGRALMVLPGTRELMDVLVKNLQRNATEVIWQDDVLVVKYSGESNTGWDADYDFFGNIFESSQWPPDPSDPVLTAFLDILDLEMRVDAGGGEVTVRLDFSALLAAAERTDDSPPHPMAGPGSGRRKRSVRPADSTQKKVSVDDLPDANSSRYRSLLAAEIAGAEIIYVLLDFDGTTSKIVSRPEDAVLHPRVRAVIDANPDKRVVFGFVSGRSIAEMREKLGGLKVDVIVGNHGRQIEAFGTTVDLTGGTAEYQKSLDELRDLLRENFFNVDGVEIEEKGSGFTIHYRNVDSSKIGDVQYDIAKILSPFVSEGRVGYETGRMAVEIVPPDGQNKGTGIQKVLELGGEKDSTVIYIGDDTTDEKAFEVLHGEHQHAIKVVSDETGHMTFGEAKLRSVDDVADFLEGLFPISSVETQPAQSLQPRPRTGVVPPDTSVIIVANRAPVTPRFYENDQVSFVVGSGGLVSAITSTRAPLTWLGWPGMVVEPEMQGPLETELVTASDDIDIGPVYLTESEYQLHYEGYSNGTLWPLLHGMDENVIRYRGDIETYIEVNAKFAEAAFERVKADLELNPDETVIVWIQDYQLFLVPAMLRALLKQNKTDMSRVKIGFFLHVPFPDVHSLRSLDRDPADGFNEPRMIIDGILGADMIGFHTPGYRTNFLEAVHEYTDNRELPDGRVAVNGRVTKVGVYPIGIDPDSWREAALTEKAEAVAAELRAIKEEGYQVIFDGERADYTKGILEKLRAYEAFLELYPEYRGKVVLYLVTEPTRTNVPTFAAYWDRIQAEVRRINDKYAVDGRRLPIHLRTVKANKEEMAGFYSEADVLFVTPLMDGMNLISFEMVAVGALSNNPGVVVLSQFAGAAHWLPKGGFLSVDPNDPLGMATSLNDALLKTPEERRKMREESAKYVERKTAAGWAGSFLGDLSKAKRERGDPAHPMAGQGNGKKPKIEKKKVTVAVQRRPIDPTAIDIAISDMCIGLDPAIREEIRAEAKRLAPYATTNDTPEGVVETAAENLGYGGLPGDFGF